MLSPIILRAYLSLKNRADLARDEVGQTTAEYAMVIVAAAVVGGLLIAWAGSSGFIDKLFDVTVGRVIKEVK